MDFWDLLHLIGAAGAVLMVVNAVWLFRAIRKAPPANPFHEDAEDQRASASLLDDLRFGKHGPTYRQFGDDIRKW